MARKMQLRLIYSLLKPAVRCAARFGVPVRTLSELLRIALYEELAGEGLNTTEIAERLGQTPRHARSLRQKLNGDFFDAEKQIGLTRELEDWIATHATCSRTQLLAQFAHVDAAALESALSLLLEQERIEQDEHGHLKIGHKYVVLTSDQFHHRVDALNHHLDAVYRSAIERLVLDNRQTAMMKTVSFSAQPAALDEFMRRLEGHLRQEVADLEEQASFAGENTRFTMGLSFAPLHDEP